MPTRYYWDSCAFIDRIARTPGRIRMLQHVTDEAEAGNVEIVTSAFGIAEVVFCKDAQGNRLDDDIEEIRRFFDHPFIFVRQVDRTIAEYAATITRDHGLKPPDAVHLATAIKTNCSALHTYDGRHLLPLDGLVGTPPMRIEEPVFQLQSRLEFSARNDAAIGFGLPFFCRPKKCTVNGEWNIRRPGTLQRALSR